MAVPDRIETRRLVLRRFRPEDFGAYHAIVSREDVARFTSYEPRSREEAGKELERRLTDPAMDQPGQMLVRAVALPDENRIVGEVMIFARDIDARQGEIGYVLHPEFHGRGYGLEAARAMMAVAFERLGYHRVFGRCDARHSASAALMERLGMRREAHLREHAIFKGEWDNLLIYALLEDEWKAQRDR